MSEQKGFSAPGGKIINTKKNNTLPPVYIQICMATPKRAVPSDQLKSRLRREISTDLGKKRMHLSNVRLEHLCMNDSF